MPAVTFLDALLTPRILLAGGVYALLAVLEPFLEHAIERRCHDNPPALWCVEHLGLPLLRAGCVVLFVWLAYPALFGLRVAPDLAALLAPHEHGTSTAVGVAFLVALAAPVLPILHRHPEFVLPVQGMLATALLFTWLTDYLHATRATVWPGADTLLLAGLVAWGMHRIAATAGRALGATADGIHGTDGWDRIATHVTTLLAQLPVILIYGMGLARQIAP